jgi:hypothetical protein
MTRAFTLLLTGALAVAAPAASVAQDMLTVTNMTGQLRIQIDSPIDHVDRTTPIVNGRLEIQMGPQGPGSRLFILTRANLEFADITINTTSLQEHALPLLQIAAQARDALRWSGTELQAGVYEIAISPHGIPVAHDEYFPDGDPTFLCSAKVGDSYFVNNPHPVITDRFLGNAERVDEPIVGVIDLNAKIIQVTAVFRDAKEFLPGVKVTRTFTVTLIGSLDPKGGGTDGPGRTGR